MYVRKKSDRTHSTFGVEIPEKLANGIDHPLRVVFVDDTIDSGKTFKKSMFGSIRADLIGPRPANGRK